MVIDSKIGLVVDDICSLPEKLVNEYQIEIVKTKLYFPEWEKFPEKNLYQVMRETKAGPKTSAPSPGDYLKAYKKTLEKFEKVLVVTLSSKLSATYSSARQAKELMPDPSKIFIFDSLSAATPEGLLTFKAAQLIREGKDIEEILKILEELREKIKFFGFLETTYWVEKIGRMSHWQATAFKILKGFGVQPMLGIKKGKVALTGFNFWTKDTFKALFHQLASVARREMKVNSEGGKLHRSEHEAKKSKKIQVGINYTDNIDLAYKLKEKVEKELEGEVVFISPVPPIVGANSGPGTLIAGCLPTV
ncbi:MAG: hypothetical protein COS25_02155 [Candidatus Nealsonbacteria bacterium CG02_land_8_20_14_3_00_37_10]|uniref:DegV family protein n=1 Tax=Candidatus Nealsonbacteria bacterium CG02_land_8_20_14_3_00_37_10 TaxID=1974699 RepID=A0A2M7D951_9BACT|nr:MAG: hypothetical protein COS25_02155 [Candidatus Nealsonbacteria bacterium CG02_land_8_20_14_3_00_37_10]